MTTLINHFVRVRFLHVACESDTPELPGITETVSNPNAIRVNARNCMFKQYSLGEIIFTILVATKI